MTFVHDKKQNPLKNIAKCKFYDDAHHAKFQRVFRHLKATPFLAQRGKVADYGVNGSRNTVLQSGGRPLKRKPLASTHASLPGVVRSFTRPSANNSATRGCMTHSAAWHSAGATAPPKMTETGLKSKCAGVRNNCCSKITRYRQRCTILTPGAKTWRH